MKTAKRLGWMGVWFIAAATATAAEPPTFAGPTMGTSYRVRLAAEIAGRQTSAVHREVDDLLARIDRAASTWRSDSDVSRFNRAAADEWVAVGEDLAAIIAVAREVHRSTDGAFDVTAAPLVRLWGEGPERRDRRPAPPAATDIDRSAGLVGMQLVCLRPPAGERPAAVRKAAKGVEMDLSAVAPGYAVDAVGTLLVALGSRSHLVELGGEVRAWGRGPDGRPWRVLVRGGDAEPSRVVDLAAGTALATATIRPGRSPIDPRTGRPVTASAVRSVTVRAGSCAEADALATATAVLGVEAARSRGIDVVGDP